MIRRIWAALVTAYAALVLAACIAAQVFSALPSWAQWTTGTLMLSAVLFAAAGLLRGVYLLVAGE